MTVEDWGLIDYTAGFHRQRELVRQVIAGAPDHLVFCEHPAVLTLGRMTGPGSLLFDRKTIEERGVQIVNVDRGGDVTLHAPGQLVIYPIFNLNHQGRDLRIFMERLEELAVDLLKNFGILALSMGGRRGVFAGRDKIVSIGVGVRKWVAYHGLGVNVNTELSFFDLIKPCGLDVRMTSMRRCIGHDVAMNEVKGQAASLFKERFSHD